MKKTVIALVGVYFIFLFLLYSGMLRNNNDPLAVTDYYLECLINREGFMTYHISTRDFFNDDKYGALYKKFKLNNISQMKLVLIANKNNIANVGIKIGYKDKQNSYLVAELKKSDNGWLINNLQHAKE